MEHRLLRPDQKDTENLEDYRQVGGYEALQSIQKIQPKEMIAELEASGLRGRGGAGFPAFRKWQGVSESKGTHYVVINATEGEPDSLKDRTLLTSRPHLIIEGLLIACKAVKSTAAWIVVNEEFADGLKALSTAVNEVRKEGLIGKVDIRILTAPPRYVVGEETALLNWIEGKPAKPRFKLHLPVQKGLWEQPTLIQNAETISNVPYIFRHGAKAYQSIGTESSPGTALFSVQGDVELPGLYELPLGIPLTELIKMAGGMKDNKQIKAALIGGNFGGFLYGEALEVKLDYESLKEVGGSLGCGIVRVYHQDHSIEQAADDVLSFFSEETCGQCGPCYMGTEAMRNEFRKYRDNPSYDIQKLADYSVNLRRKGACGLIDGAAIVAGTIVNYLNEERRIKF
jgi:NADH-quinone oxidoreductase subunit F